MQTFRVLAGSDVKHSGILTCDGRRKRFAPACSDEHRASLVCKSDNEIVVCLDTHVVSEVKKTVPERTFVHTAYDKCVVVVKGAWHSSILEAFVSHEPYRNSVVFHLAD